MKDITASLLRALLFSSSLNAPDLSHAKVANVPTDWFSSRSRPRQH